MINESSIKTIAAQTVSPAHVRPDYTGYNFANIPGSMLRLLGLPVANVLPEDALPVWAGIDRVIFLLVDGFGWNLVERLADRSSLLQRIRRDGRITQLTSQFPSTTTAHVTTMNTNQPVGQHGMFEWNYYEPQLDRVITPFLYAYAGDPAPMTLAAAGVKAETLFPRHSIYDLLAAHGVDSYAFAGKSYAHSPYNVTMDRAATGRFAYGDLSEGLALLSEAMNAANGRAYAYMHWGAVDTLGHFAGPFSDEATAELGRTLALIESELIARLPGDGKTLLLIGADHGQDPIDPAQTVFLNRLLPDISAVFRHNRAGAPIVPGGSARSFFLYIKDDSLHEARQLLGEALAGVAEVWVVEQLIEEGYFGRPISDTFRGRVGNLVILPHPGQSVWWYDPGRFDMPFSGHHGGLSTNEMLIPLLSLVI